MSHILIVEDEPVIRTALRKLLERHDHSVVEAGSVEQAAELELTDFDLIISDLRLPGAPGTDLIQQARPAPVLIMTSYASLRSAVDAMKLGAVDYIAKPFDHDEMVMAVNRILKERAMRRGQDVLRADVAQRYPVHDLIGQCPAMTALLQQVERIAPTSSTVLICGESGSGKELLARTLHDRSDRSRGPMVTISCASLPAEELEQQLFGVERDGNGQGQSRRGLVEIADGGTLFLDDIDELPASAQGRLLQVLEHQTVQRLGAAEGRRVHVRIMAASHRDLPRLVGEGRFREDLYYRLQVIQLTLPPLRDRGDDIQHLADSLLERVSARLNLRSDGFTEDARDALARYHWPGNVRELENAIERAVILADGGAISEDLLGINSSLPARTLQDPSEDLSLEDYFARFVMENQDHMTETELARKLGISRKCLWERRQRLGIPRSRSGTAG